MAGNSWGDRMAMENEDDLHQHRVAMENGGQELLSSSPGPNDVDYYAVMDIFMGDPFMDALKTVGVPEYEAGTQSNNFGRPYLEGERSIHFALPEHGDGSGVQVGEEQPVSNSPSKISKKRKATKWKATKRSEALDTEKTESRSRLLEGVESLKEHIDQKMDSLWKKLEKLEIDRLVKKLEILENAFFERHDKILCSLCAKHCFVGLNGAEFGKLKLATRMTDEHGSDTLPKLSEQQQHHQGEGPALNPPTELPSRKRTRWTEQQTDRLIKEVVSPKTEPQSVTDAEPFWEGVAKGVPGKTGMECRRRMETLKKSSKQVKGYCLKEEKEFGELEEADFGKMKLATQINEKWYNRIIDFCQRSSKRSPGIPKNQGHGSSSTSGTSLAAGNFLTSGEDGEPHDGIDLCEEVRLPELQSSPFGIPYSSAARTWSRRAAM